MKILVNGVERELVANGINGVEWTNDLLGNYDALHYNTDIDEYEMTEEEFDWWSEVIDMLNEVSELENELDSDTREEYEAESWASDLDDETRGRLNWLKERVGKN